MTRTLNRIKKYVWWPGMAKDIGDFINACPICNALKPMKTAARSSGSLSAPRLFDIVSLDFIGERSHIGKSYHVLVIVDHYSRFMATAVIWGKKANPVPELLFKQHWVAVFGVPRVVLCDRDPVFRSERFTTCITKELGAKLFFSSAAYPQGNGINESSHRILETAFKTHSWAEYDCVEDVVVDATLIYNATPNVALGDTPASVMFGCDPRIPGLGDLELESSEEVRYRKMSEFRGLSLVRKELARLESMVKEPGVGTEAEFNVGDIVTYKLSDWHSSRTKHHSGDRKYSPVRSFPHRVTGITANDVKVVPLWTKGEELQVPKAQCRVLASFIPELMRQEAQALYPMLPWLPSVEAGAQGATSSKRAAPDSGEAGKSTSPPKKKKKTAK